MPARRTNEPAEEPSAPRRRPATTPEAREKQMIAMAIDVAEEQMRDRTVSSQVLTHYLKLGTRQHELELEKLRYDTQFMQAKIESLESAKRVEAIYEEALAAMKSYTGQIDDGFEPEEFYEVDGD